MILVLYWNKLSHSMSRAKFIDDYITEHPECKLNKTEPVMLGGKSVDIPVYKLPFHEQPLLVFNITNGRIKVQYDEVVKKLGRPLDPTDREDSKKLQQMLLSIQKTEHLNEFIDNLEDFGQIRNAICTFEGRVINGNRRMAGLQKLVSEKPGRKDFGFLNVARLPENTTEDDVYKIELGLQMSRRVQLDYSATNALLKFQEGIKHGMEPKEIAQSLFGGFKEKEILEKLQQIKLIDSYTRWRGEPGNFFPIEKQKITEHFVDAGDVLQKAESAGLSLDQQEKIQEILFQLIHDGEPQRSLRDVANSFNDPEILDEMLSGAEHSKPGNIEQKAKDKQDAKDNDRATPTRAILDNVRDSVKNKKLAKEPEKQLENVRKILRRIDTDSPHLQSNKAKDIFGEVHKLISAIKDALEK